MFWAPRGWHQRSALNPPIQHVLAPNQNTRLHFQTSTTQAGMRPSAGWHIPSFRFMEVPRDQYLHRKQAARPTKFQFKARNIHFEPCINCKLCRRKTQRETGHSGVHSVYHCKRRHLGINQSLCLRSRSAFAAHCVSDALAQYHTMPPQYQYHAMPLQYHTIQFPSNTIP